MKVTLNKIDDNYFISISELWGKVWAGITVVQTDDEKIAKQKAKTLAKTINSSLEILY